MDDKVEASPEKGSGKHGAMNEDTMCDVKKSIKSELKSGVKGPKKGTSTRDY